MSAIIDDGGPAYPCQEQNIHGEPMMAMQFGLSIRDYFAGQALAAMTAAPDYSKGPCNHAMAERAFLIADEMIIIRRKGGPQS